MSLWRLEKVVVKPWRSGVYVFLCLLSHFLSNYLEFDKFKDQAPETRAPCCVFYSSSSDSSKNFSDPRSRNLIVPV
jgi:hypothetical protein